MSTPVPPRRGLARRVLRSVERAFAVLGLVGVVYHLCLNLSPIRSPSMAPTLVGTDKGPADWVLTERLTYRLRGPRRFELVAFHAPDGIRVIKRVMGLPGESLSVKGIQVFVNGSPVTLPASLQGLKYYPYGLLAPGRTASSGGGYFLLGDDSQDSQDSRFEGPLPRPDIEGRPWLIVWPPSRAGFANP